MNKILTKLMKFAEWFMEWFVIITTGELIICTVNFCVFSDGEDIPRSTLPRIILSALLTAVVTAGFFTLELVKKSSIIIGSMLHFCCLTGIMIVCGICFEWIDFKASGIVRMTVSVAAVYVFVFFVYYIMDKHRAEQINRRLWEKYKDEEV